MNPDSEIANISVPGLTASDACAIFYQHFWKKKLSDVIIYLGNCDSASNEIRKSRYTKKRHFVQRVKEGSALFPRGPDFRTSCFT